MTARSGRGLSAMAVAAVLALAGCGGSGSEETQSGQGTAGASARPTEKSATATPTQRDAPARAEEPAGVETEDDAVEIEVEIENGQVTPSGERVDVRIGQPIRFVVDSDSADEIHVHSTPEHSFSFPAGAEDREFEFTLAQPGVVEAELHELGDVVVTIAARP